MCNRRQNNKKNSLMRGGLAIIIAMLTLCVVLVVFVNPKQMEPQKREIQEEVLAESKMPESDKVSEAKAESKMFELDKASEVGSEHTEEIRVRLMDAEESAVQDTVSGRAAKDNAEKGALAGAAEAQDIMSSYQRVITQAARGMRADGSVYHILGKGGNRYVITDIEGDEQVELLLCMGDAAVEDQCLQVIEYDKESGEMRIAFTGRPGAEFYRNGIIKQARDNKKEKGQEEGLFDIYELNQQNRYVKTREVKGAEEDLRTQAENKLELVWTRF